MHDKTSKVIIEEEDEENVDFNYLKDLFLNDLKNKSE